MHRREFLASGTRSALALSLLPLAACSHTHRAPAKSINSSSLDAIITDLEQQIPSHMDVHTVPGVSIALVENGKLSWRRGFGVKDRLSKVPVDHDTLFEAGSMSKPVFAYVALKLCERRILELDTPLTRFTSERFLEDDSRLDLITPRHLLSHTSGFQNWRSSENPLRIHFTPGEKFLYSGEGYFYLQSVVTHLKGRIDRTNCATYEADLEVCATDIDSFLKTNLLHPFGMTSSGYVLNERSGNLASTGHDHAGKPFPRKKARPSDPARYASAGGLHTTPTDYARFLIEILDPKPADAFRLNQSTIREMLRPHIKTDYPFPSSWALGWQVNHASEGELIQHGGDNTGFHCYSVMSVPRQSACVIMTNGDNGPKLIFDLFSLPAISKLLYG